MLVPCFSFNNHCFRAPNQGSRTHLTIYLMGFIISYILRGEKNEAIYHMGCLQSLDWCCTIFKWTKKNDNLSTTNQILCHHDISLISLHDLRGHFSQHTATNICKQEQLTISDWIFLLHNLTVITQEDWIC